MSAAGADWLSAASILAITAAVAVGFPAESLWFRATETAGAGSPSASFVFLDASGEGAVMRAARDSWRREGVARKVCADLFFEELPETAHRPALPVERRSRPSDPRVIECPMTPFLPSQRARPPARIEAEAPSAEPDVFSREELLKIK